MKITGQSNLTPPAQVSSTEPVGSTKPVQSAQVAQTPQDAELLKPAQAALDSMGDIDQEKVAFLRGALARGEIPFDPDRLAKLVQRFHGGGN